MQCYSADAASQKHVPDLRWKIRVIPKRHKLGVESQELIAINTWILECETVNNHVKQYEVLLRQR